MTTQRIFQQFHSVGEMFASMYRGEVEPGDMIACGHCDWEGTTTEWPSHLLTCPDDPNLR